MPEGSKSKRSEMRLESGRSENFLMAVLLEENEACQGIKISRAHLMTKKGNNDYNRIDIEDMKHELGKNYEDMMTGRVVAQIITDQRVP